MLKASGWTGQWYNCGRGGLGFLLLFSVQHSTFWFLTVSTFKKKSLMQTVEKNFLSLKLAVKNKFSCVFVRTPCVASSCQVLL